MNHKSVNVEILASTAIVEAASCFPARIVMCRMPNEYGEDGYEYVSWMEVFPPPITGSTSYFTQGNYSLDATKVWAKFSERAQALLELVMERPVKLAPFPYNRPHSSKYVPKRRLDGTEKGAE